MFVSARVCLFVCLFHTAIRHFSPYIDPSLLRPGECPACCVDSAGTQDLHNKDSVAAFIEEAVVRRELAENFCYYNQHYDSVEGAPAWAQETLRLHAGDKREAVYSEVQLEEGITHDPLWNAAQVSCLW